MSSNSNSEDLTLPKATISKLIKEYLSPEVRCANETRDLIVEACVEFVQMVASEANEVCTQENKKTISPDHVITALEHLGYQEYTKEVSDVYETQKLESMKQQSKSKKFHNSGLTEEELKLEQQRLFEKARNTLTSPISPSVFAPSTASQYQTSATSTPVTTTMKTNQQQQINSQQQQINPQQQQQQQQQQQPSPLSSISSNFPPSLQQPPLSSMPTLLSPSLASPLLPTNSPTIPLISSNAAPPLISFNMNTQQKQQQEQEQQQEGSPYHNTSQTKKDEGDGSADSQNIR